MRALDDKANPYAGQYAEWDYWAYANGKELTAADWDTVSADLPESKLKFMSFGVDKDGFPVPLLQQYHEQYARMQNPTAETESTCSVGFSVYGPITPELDQALLAAEMSVKAPLLPEVPKWLAAQPPQWALLLPNGEVVAVGELGSGRDSELNFCYSYGEQPVEFGCARYSAEGKLLAKLEPGHDWYELYWPTAAEALKQYDGQQTMRMLELGYVVVRKQADWSVAAVYDYDGTPQPVDTQTYARNGLVWYGLSGRELPAVYAAQKRK